MSHTNIHVHSLDVLFKLANRFLPRVLQFSIITLVYLKCTYICFWTIINTMWSISSFVPGDRGQNEQQMMQRTDVLVHFHCIHVWYTLMHRTAPMQRRKKLVRLLDLFHSASLTSHSNFDHTVLDGPRIERSFSEESPTFSKSETGKMLNPCVIHVHANEASRKDQQPAKWPFG